MPAVSASETLTQLGRYEILGELGQGSMGVVYKARDPALDRVVAIKTINLNLPKDELAEYEARFYQEARAAGGLNHPNIVTIYDIGKSERVAYMAMEFLEGDELRSILTAGQPLPVIQALDVAAQVAEGLFYAHENHIVHRDIKPTNIMVVRDGLVKITDFGIARMRTNEVKTMTGMILGSPKYMSPEQVAGKRADQRSDLFSLGVVLYEMVTGQTPFQSDSIHGIMYQILNSTPIAASLRNPELPEVVDLIIAKALNKNMEERYQSARDLAKDLLDCKKMLQGRAAVLAKLPTEQRGEPPAPNATRRQDKVLPIKSASMKVADAAGSKPALTLAKGFDSYEATMRLAAMTGMDKELTGFDGDADTEGDVREFDHTGSTGCQDRRFRAPHRRRARRQLRLAVDRQHRGGAHRGGTVCLALSTHSLIAHQPHRFFDPVHCEHLQPFDPALGRVGARYQRLGEAQLGRLAQTLLPALHWPHFSSQAHFPEYHQLGGQRFASQRRHDGQQNGEVGGRFVDLHSAHRVDEHVLVVGRHARMPMQYRQQHGQAVLLQSHREAPRVGRVRLVHQRLYLDQQRSRALLSDQHAGAGNLASVLRQEQRGGIGNAAQSFVGHGEHAQLVDRAEPVLGRAHQSKAGVGVAFEVQHTVHHVLEHARPRDGAFLGDVAHEQQGGAGSLREARELRGALAHLRHAARRRLQRFRVHGLDRVHYRYVGLSRAQHGEDLLQLDLGQHLERIAIEPQPPRAQRQLLRALLTADV